MKNLKTSLLCLTMKQRYFTISHRLCRDSYFEKQILFKNLPIAKYNHKQSL
jgi:hypothetical protein